MKIITLASTKGGVGKSTYAVALTNAFLAIGQTVRIVDLDPQRSAHRWATEVSKQETGLSTFNVDLPEEANIVECYNFISEQIDDEPDWVIIDTRGTNDPKTYAALALADLVLVPSGPVADEVRAIEITLQNYKNALEMTGDDADPKDHFRVLYQRPGQFPNADMLSFQELIRNHYGAIDGLPTMSAIKSFLGWQTTTKDLIDEAKKDNKSPATFIKMQDQFTALANTIEGELNAA